MGGTEHSGTSSGWSGMGLCGTRRTELGVAGREARDGTSSDERRRTGWGVGGGGKRDAARQDGRDRVWRNKAWRGEQHGQGGADRLCSGERIRAGQDETGC